jgi:hypothetical protein
MGPNHHESVPCRRGSAHALKNNPKNFGNLRFFVDLPPLLGYQIVLGPIKNLYKAETEPYA